MMSQCKILICGIIPILFLYGCPNPASIALIGVMPAGGIVNAFEEGTETLPYFVYSDTTLESINEVCKITPSIKVSIEDTYRAAYGKNFNEIPPDGNTGQAFRNMNQASLYLQKILKEKGNKNAEDYILTTIDTEQKKGYILLAVVNRPHRSISVKDKSDRESETTLTERDREFYRPYPSDTKGRRIDTIIDWAGLPNDCVSKQGSQAILLTLTANQILGNKVRSDYWLAENRWMNGEFRNIMKEQDEKTCIVCGYEEGFFKG